MAIDSRYDDIPEDVRDLAKLVGAPQPAWYSGTMGGRTGKRLETLLDGRVTDASGNGNGGGPSRTTEPGAGSPPAGAERELANPAADDA